MIDHITPERRSWNMSKIRVKDTKLEKIVRSLLHYLGYRFRLHSNKLPGKPDIVLPKYKTVIFVHGCFWHRHKDCHRASMPKTNQNYWFAKFEKNVKRFEKVKPDIENLGWHVLVIW